MEQLNNEQTKVNEQALEKAPQEQADEKKDENTVSLGKFKDVNSLISAYNSLQAEFTKRCQRIKELESQAPCDKVDTPQDVKTKSQDEIESLVKVQNQPSKEEVLKDYLTELLSSKQQAIVMDRAGLSIKAPVVKPKTIAEAGMLAKDFLNQTQK